MNVFALWLPDDFQLYPFFCVGSSDSSISVPSVPHGHPKPDPLFDIFWYPDLVLNTRYYPIFRVKAKFQVYPERIVHLSFENHGVAGNLKFQVLPDFSDKHEVSGSTGHFGFWGDINFRRLRFLTGTVTQTFAKHASVQSIFAQYVQNLYTIAQTPGDQNATRGGLLSQKPEAWRTMFKKTAE